MFREFSEQFDVPYTLSKSLSWLLCGSIVEAGTLELVDGSLALIGKSSGDVVSVSEIGQSNSLLGGKAVTAITGLALSGEALAQLGKQLKTLCGSGGTVKDGVIEIQGDHVERVVDALKKSGHAAKRSGG